MTTPKADIGIEPVVLDTAQTAALLNMGVEGFRKKRRKLEKAGFPQADPLLRGYYRRAILAWLDGRHGLDRVWQKANAEAEREKEQW